MDDQGSVLVRSGISSLRRIQTSSGAHPASYR